MIESIFQLKWVVSRHQQAPLLKEREQFLAHCQQHGTSHKALWGVGHGCVGDNVRRTPVQSSGDPESSVMSPTHCTDLTSKSGSRRFR